MRTLATFTLLTALALLSACATPELANGHTRMGSAHRARLTQTFSNAAMSYHKCDHVDSIESSVIASDELIPWMKTIMRPEGSTTERWVTTLCGKRIENKVFRGRLLSGGWATLVQGCSGPGATNALTLVNFPETSNGLSERFAGVMEKGQGAKSDLTGPASQLVPLMTCTDLS